MERDLDRDLSTQRRTILVLCAPPSLAVGTVGSENRYLVCCMPSTVLPAAFNSGKMQKCEYSSFSASSYGVGCPLRIAPVISLGIGENNQ